MLAEKDNPRAFTQLLGNPGLYFHCFGVNNSVQHFFKNLALHVKWLYVFIWKNLFLGMYQKFKKVTMYKGICLRMIFPALYILMHIVNNPNIKKNLDW